MASCSGIDVRVMTFNVLCPRYKVNRRVCEANSRDKVAERAGRVGAVVAEAQPDVVVLQEVWLADEAYMDVLTAAMDEGAGSYTWETMQRSGTKEDGLAVGVLDAGAAVVGMSVLERVDFGAGDFRVGLVVRLDLSNGAAVVMGATHMSFPKDGRSVRNQGKQIKALTGAVDKAVDAIESAGGAPVAGTLIAGDLNAQHDSVTEWLFGCGYTDGWDAVHGSRDGLVTHKTHTRATVAVDYVAYRANHPHTIDTTAAALLPDSLTASVWPRYAEWSTSDHRPVLVSLAITGP